MRRLLAASVLTALALVTSAASRADAGGSPVLLAAGDIAGCSWTADEATGLLLDASPGEVAALGDNAYEDGTPDEYAQCYDPAWGRALSRTRPTPGNHDYHTAGAAGYFGYFGAAAGDPAKGYYSYDLGSWHIVVLNSNCDAVGGCDFGSAEAGWLQADLGASTASCTLAYWHHPRFSSGGDHGSDAGMFAFWRILWGYGADVVLSGHDHDYERFAPQDPWGVSDPQYGLRELVVGTGGAPLAPFGPTVANSEVRDATTHGVLKLTLGNGAYSWEFLPADGTFTDSGTGTCHGAPPPPPPGEPPPPPPPSPPPPPPPPPPPHGDPVCVVPRVLGVPLRTARLWIRRARCSVGSVSYRKSRTPRGLVIAQSPRAGRRFFITHRVTLVVSRGRR